jgi:hypothetical protein
LKTPILTAWLCLFSLCGFTAQHEISKTIATVRLGPYAGDQLSVDHIIPRSVCPELDNVIANLELMPERMNTGKGAKVGQRQHDLARKLNGAGLLSDAGMKAVLRGGDVLRRSPTSQPTPATHLLLFAIRTIIRVFVRKPGQ